MNNVAIAKAAAGLVDEMPERERPLEEQFRIAGRIWSKADAEKERLQKLREPTLERIKIQLSQLPGNTLLSDAALKRMAMCTPEYLLHIEAEATAIEKANDAWVDRKAIEIKARQKENADSNLRHEARLGR